MYPAFFGHHTDGYRRSLSPSVGRVSGNRARRADCPLPRRAPGPCLGHIGKNATNASGRACIVMRHSHHPQHSGAVPKSMGHRPRRAGLGYWTQWAVLVLLLCTYAVLAVIARRGTISLLVAGAVVFPVLTIASVNPASNVKDHIAIIGISFGNSSPSSYRSPSGRR